MSVEKPTFREVVAKALERAHVAGVDLELSAFAVARFLQEELKAAGYSIHRSGECVHPRGPKPSELGRPMTRDEAILVGLLAVGENLDLEDESPAT